MYPNEEDAISPTNPNNPMAAAYNDPELNAYEEGPVAFECKENCRIVLKNVPVNLKGKIIFNYTEAKINCLCLNLKLLDIFLIIAHAIENILKQFGKVVDINIPKNQENFSTYREGFKVVFVEFSMFWCVLNRSH